jgi:RNA polymerase sporulation-specific sigma factor
MDDAADQAIFAAVDKGDMNRAAALIQRHYGAVLLGHARRLVGAADADDVYQNGLVALVGALQKRKLGEGSSLRSYAVTTVRNEAFRLNRSWFKRLLRRAELMDGEDDMPAPSSKKPPPWGDADEEELIRRIRALLDKEQRVVVSMRLGDRSTFAEIGRKLQTSEATVRKIFSRAVQSVRALLVVDERGVLVLPEKPSGGGRGR